LRFNKNNTTSYSFFSGLKHSASTTQQVREEIITDLLESIFENFICYYIPASHLDASLYETIIQEYILEEIAEILEDKTSEIHSSLSNIGNSINSILENNCKTKEINFIFDIQKDNIRSLLAKLPIFLQDNHLTKLKDKGMGIQAMAILAALVWVNKKIIINKKNAIWLIEEPESHLHPELQKYCHKLIDKLREESQVFITTHSLGFIGNNVNKLIGVTKSKEGYCETKVYKDIKTATKKIKDNLGLKPADYLNLSRYNCLLEGDSDVDLIKWVLDILKPTETKTGKKIWHWEKLRESNLFSLGGATEMEKYVKENDIFFDENHFIVAVVDGDTTGQHVIKNLFHYFRNKNKTFSPSKDYFILSNEASCLELLFDKIWVREYLEKHGKSDSIIKDLNDVELISALDVYEKKALREAMKKRVLEEIKEKKDSVWAKNFIDLFDKIEHVFSTKDSTACPSTIPAQKS